MRRALRERPWLPHLSWLPRARRAHGGCTSTAFEVRIKKQRWTSKAVETPLRWTENGVQLDAFIFGWARVVEIGTRGCHAPRACVRLARAPPCRLTHKVYGAQPRTRTEDRAHAQRRRPSARANLTAAPTPRAGRRVRVWCIVTLPTSGCACRCPYHRPWRRKPPSEEFAKPRCVAPSLGASRALPTGSLSSCPHPSPPAPDWPAWRATRATARAHGEAPAPR